MTRVANVDRDNEIALFEAMLAGKTSERILVVCAESGWGKSILLREFERRCLANIPHFAKLDFKSCTSLAETLSHLCDSLGWSNFPHFRADVMVPGEIRQNHTTFLALDLFCAHRYYRDKYGLAGLERLEAKYEPAMRAQVEAVHGDDGEVKTGLHTCERRRWRRRRPLAARREKQHRRAAEEYQRAGAHGDQPRSRMEAKRGPRGRGAAGGIRQGGHGDRVAEEHADGGRQAKHGPGPCSGAPDRAGRVHR